MRMDMLLLEQRSHHDSHLHPDSIGRSRWISNLFFFSFFDSEHDPCVAR